MRVLTSIAACYVVLCSAAAGSAQSSGGPDPKRLEELARQYAEAEKRERKTFLAQFDKAAKSLANNRQLTREQRIARANAVNEEKKAFEADGTLPGSNDMLDEVYAYQERLHNARKPLAALYASAAEKALKAGNAAEAKRIVGDKVALDEKLPGRDRFTEKTFWKGSRHGPRGNTDFGLWIGPIDGNAIKGRAWQNRGGDEFEMEGRLDGNFIEVYTSKVDKGGNRLLVFSGFILGDRLALNVSGVTVKNAAARGLVLLRKEKKN